MGAMEHPSWREIGRPEKPPDRPVVIQADKAARGRQHVIDNRNRRKGKAVETATSYDYRLVPVNRLRVDREGGLQRDLDFDFVKREIMDRFEPRKLGTLVVSGRENGELVVLDGQHRLIGVRELISDHHEGAPNSLWCEILFGLSLTDEADIFLGRNTRRNVNQIDMFRNRVLKGEPTATYIAKYLARYDKRVTGGSKGTQYGTPVVLEKLYNWGVLDETIDVIETALSDTPQARSNTFVHGLGIFMLSMAGTRKSIDSTQVAGKFATALKVTAVLRTARDRAAALGSSQSVEVARAIAQVWNKWQSDSRKLDVIVPKGMRA
jgi:hypothetical protein